MSEVIRELTVQISANGASTAQKDIKGLQNAVDLAEAKFKAAGAGVAGFEKSTAGMQARVTMLSDKLKLQNAIVDKAAGALEKARSKMTNAANEQAKYKAKVDAARAALEKEVAASGANSDASKALADELKKLEGQHNAEAKAAQTAAQSVQRGEAALEKLKAEVKGTEAELKAANATLQKHGSAWAQAGQKIAAAGEKLGSAGKKISAVGRSLTTNVTIPVVAAGAAAFKAWETMDDGLDTVIRKTGATGAALVPLEKAYNNVFLGVKTTAEDAGIAVGEVNTRFKSTGTELESLSTLFIQFADVNQTDLNASIGNTAKVLAQWKQPASAAAGFLGLLTSESQRTGISMEKLMDSVQANGATLKGMGMNLSQSVQLMADFEAAGVNADVALAALKKSAAAYSKDGMSLEQGLSATVKAIQNAKNETSALAIAQKAFGAKGALEMATAIREGRFAVTGLSADMGKMGGVVSKTFAEINGDTPVWDRVKNKLISTGASIGKNLLPWIEKAADRLSALVEGFASLDPAMQQNIVTMAGIGAAVGPALSGIGKIATGFGSLSKLFTGPAGWIALAVTAFAGLAVAINSIKTPMQQVKDRLKNIKVNVDSSAVQQLTTDMQAGLEAAKQLNDIKISVDADTTKISEALEKVFTDDKLTSKEKKFVTKTFTDVVSPDIDAARLALDGMTADAKKATESLLAEYDTAYGNFSTLLNKIYEEKRTPTEDEIKKLNEYLAQIGVIREQLQAANVEAIAAAQAQYNLTVAGRGDDKSAAAAIGLVKGNQDQSIANAEAARTKALAESAGDLNKAAKANEDYTKAVADANAEAVKGYQAIIDGIAKAKDADTIIATLKQDADAIKALMSFNDTEYTTLNFSRLREQWRSEVDALFGKNGQLRNYLTEENKIKIDDFLAMGDRAGWNEMNSVKTLAENMLTQLSLAIEKNKDDKNLSPVLAAVQSLFDTGALDGIDLTQFTGAMETAIETLNLPRLFEDSGASAGSSLATGISAQQTIIVGSVTSAYQAAIDEANRMKPRLAAAMGSLNAGPGGSGSYYGRSGAGSTSYSSSLNIENFNASGQADIDIMMANMARMQKNQQAAYGKSPTRLGG